MSSLLSDEERERLERIRSIPITHDSGQRLFLFSVLDRLLPLAERTAAAERERDLVEGVLHDLRQEALVEWGRQEGLREALTLIGDKAESADAAAKIDSGSAAAVTALVLWRVATDIGKRLSPQPLPEHPRELRQRIAALEEALKAFAMMGKDVPPAWLDGASVTVMVGYVRRAASLLSGGGNE